MAGGWSTSAQETKEIVVSADRLFLGSIALGWSMHFSRVFCVLADRIITPHDV